MNTGMKTARVWVTIPALILSLIGLSACAMLTPPTTRSGAIQEVKIEEGLAPSILTVGIGDEVRWVNHRKLPVRIDFLGGALDEISCQRGFSNLIGMKKESATVGANESASLCFSKAGAILYNVRMDAPLPGGKQIAQGEIKVGSSGGTATAH